ncbi:MAG: TIGR01777 family oxidoreductase [bacterium]
MQIAISGANGLVGSAVVRAATARGDVVRRLVRREARAADEIAWNPAAGAVPGDLAGCDAVVHLAGAGIADRPWTRARRQVLVESRVDATRKLAESLVPGGPATLVMASAVGYYGDRGAEVLSEQSAPGEGFLARLTRDWEAAAEPAREAGARVVPLRFGVILARDGGALARMLPAFRLGLGARLGSGEQFFPWVSLDDVVEVILRALDDATLTGPVNVVAPGSATNAEFTRTLAGVLHRPAFFVAPAWVLRLALDGLAEEGLLASQRVRPAALEAVGFPFRDPALRPALARILASGRVGDPDDRR